MSPQGVPGAAGASQLSSGLTASPGRALGPRDDARGSWGPAGPRPLRLARGACGVAALAARVRPRRTSTRGGLAGRGAEHASGGAGLAGRPPPTSDAGPRASLSAPGPAAAGRAASRAPWRRSTRARLVLPPGRPAALTAGSTRLSLLTGKAKPHPSVRRQLWGGCQAGLSGRGEGSACRPGPGPASASASRGSCGPRSYTPFTCAELGGAPRPPGSARGCPGVKRHPLSRARSARPASLPTARPSRQGGWESTDSEEAPSSRRSPLWLPWAVVVAPGRGCPLGSR